MISGILPVDKPQGWTSHDVVARVRRVAGQKAVGHAGTLDPLATGVLILLLGKATKLSQYVMAGEKTYCAEVVLGASTVTDDAEAPLREQADVSGISESKVRAVLAGFEGEIDQVPPLYAAVKQGGQTLYRLARQGVEVQPAPRRVHVFEIRLIKWEPPHLRLVVTCAAGTYIRSLARDIGCALGVGGYLHALRRMRSGTFTVADAAPLDALGSREAVQAALLPPDRALVTWPAVVLEAGGEERIVTGRALRLPGPLHGSVRLYGRTGELLALGEASGNEVRPVRVLAGG